MTGLFYSWWSYWIRQSQSDKTVFVLGRSPPLSISIAPLDRLTRARPEGGKLSVPDVLPIVFLTWLHLISHSIKNFVQGVQTGFDRKMQLIRFHFDAVNLYGSNKLRTFGLMNESICFRKPGARGGSWRRPHISERNLSNRKYHFSLHSPCPKDDLPSRPTGYSGASVPHQKMASHGWGQCILNSVAFCHYD